MKKSLFSCFTLFLAAAFLSAQSKTVFYHTETSAAQTAQALPAMPQWPCTVSALNGVMVLDGANLERGQSLNSILDLEFATTNQVLVLTDRFQRNFYVTPRMRHFNDTGLSCYQAGTDCTPVMRNNIGTIVYVAPERGNTPRYPDYDRTTAKGGTSTVYHPVEHQVFYEETPVAQKERPQYKLLLPKQEQD